MENIRGGFRNSPPQRLLARLPLVACMELPSLLSLHGEKKPGLWHPVGAAQLAPDGPHLCPFHSGMLPLTHPGRGQGAFALS
jgi:hypothetical protein